MFKRTYNLKIITSSIFLLFFSLLIVLAIVANNKVKAANDTFAVDVVQADIECTMGVTGTDSHTANLTPGVWTPNIGTSTVTAVCNDTDGYAIYAVGFSGESEDPDVNTKLSTTVAGETYTIPTADYNAGSTDSYWSMQLSQGTGDAATIISPFNNYSAVPNTYTKVATYPSVTAGMAGSSFTTTYGVQPSLSQVAGSYEGKVKYTLVHPHTAPAPTPSTPTMQSWTDCSSMSTGDTITLKDERDGESYLVGKLADGNCWMLDNLRLDPTSVSLTNLQDKTNASNQTLTYFKNGGGSSPYPASGVSDAWTSSSQNSYDLPYVATSYKNTTTTSYGSGSGKIGVYYNYCAASAGSYCYASGAGTGDATEDICPANWRMPTGSSSGEYQALYENYSSDASSFRNALSTPLSGYFLSGSAGYQGSFGYFWSSIYYSGGNMYALFVGNSGVYPDGGGDRGGGYSVRCIAK
jgi:hypothetical protein